MPVPTDINVILATDCGSTTTKAILIQKIDGVYRQTHRGEAPTTVEEPAADVTVGVRNAVLEVGELAGRRLIDDQGEIIRPAGKDVGCDIYISTSSAGGGLQMIVAGIVREMSAASAERAALGAGAIVMDTISANDKRKPHEQVQRIRELRPDMILLAGGTDGGNLKKVVELAERIAPAKPRPRFGEKYRMPVIFAGNAAAREFVEAAFDADVTLSSVENVRPTLERENLGPARDAIHDLFLEHVMQHAPGYDRLIGWTDAPVMPTPGAVGNILERIARTREINALGVDIGGATTDVFSVFDGQFNRTVSANLGMSYSISNVVAEATLENILRWVSLEMEEGALRNRIKNKMIRPTTIPQTLESLVFEQAVAREALRLSLIQHKAFATRLKGVQQQRTIGDTFRQTGIGETLVDLMTLDLLVASGGVLSHAPRMEQTAAMLIDAFEPEGFTRLAKDSIFMMPHLGVLAEVHERAALEVFERDCLIELGTCVAPRGNAALGKTCFSYEVQGAGRNERGELRVGQMMLFPLAFEERARVTIRPARGFDCGAGLGREVTREVAGGTVGLILDARGRPLAWPEDGTRRQRLVREWTEALRLYPGTPRVLAEAS